MLNDVEYLGLVRNNENGYIASLIEVPEPNTQYPFLFNRTEIFKNYDAAANFIAAEWSKIINSN